MERDGQRAMAGGGRARCVAGWRVLGAALCFAAGLLAGGCATDPLADQRVAVFTPDVRPADRMPWRSAAGQELSGELMPESSGAGPAADAGDADADATSAPTADADTQMTSPSRMLSKDDHVSISLRGIPRPEEMAEVIDGNGNVNLPLIGLTKIDGLTTAEAEQLIERSYVQSGYYRSINVIILAQDDSFYIRGEVNRPGKYPLAGDTTLMMGVSAAGGFTDYAKETRIKVIRGDKVIWLNATRMESGRDQDFLIHADDLIVVERRIIF